VQLKLFTSPLVGEVDAKRRVRDAFSCTSFK
jgi:hypothetical protein